MCKFLSAIGLKNGDIICDPSIDSHEDIIQLHSLKESKMRNWVRIEFYPENDEDLGDLSKYELKIDDSHFDWIDKIRDKWISKLKAKLKRVIITEDTFLLSSGTYILSGKILINKLLYCRIYHAGHSTIKNAWYSTIENAGHSTIEYAGKAKISK